MSNLITATPALLAAQETDTDRTNGIQTRIVRLITHFDFGGDPRTPPADWRATYPMDDPRNKPDLWIADQSGDTVIWCKLDSHPNEAPGLPCTWCGQAHADVMDIYTYMLPSDY